MQQFTVLVDSVFSSVASASVRRDGEDELRPQLERITIAVIFISQHSPTLTAVFREENQAKGDIAAWCGEERKTHHC